MKTAKLMLLFAGLAAFAACTGEVDPVTPDSGNEGNFSLIASTDVFTKTELDASKEIHWKSGDALSVWESGNAGNANVQFDVTAASVGAAVGTFTGTLTPAGTEFTLYSVYPYSSGYGSDPTSVSLTIPATLSQYTDVNSIVGVSDFMVGRCDNTNYDSGTGAYQMLFQHPLAFINFKIDGRDCVYEQATIQSLTMTADVAFVGAVTLNCATGAVTSAETGDGGKTLVINFPSTAKMSDVQTAWAAINPVDLTDANCKFILEMTNGQKVTFNVNPKPLSAQKLYKFEFSDIDAKLAAGKATPTYYSLLEKSGGVRANCYIVNEGGYYRFAAQRVDKTNVFTGSAPSTDGYRADWLWASAPDKVSGVSIGNSGNINFRVEPGAECNAVIALRDADNNIVWSWHIWCTETDPLTPNHWGRNNAWLLANRNLGALNDNDPGLYYQWGRKDPFPADWEAATKNTGVTIKGASSKNAPVTDGAVAYTIANPTIFLYANNYQTWISSEDDAINAQSLWYTGTSKKATDKTNYDPCPPGYIVPVAAGYAWYTTFTTLANHSIVAGSSTYTNDGVTTIYPAGGYFNGAALTDYGVTVRCWAGNLSATPSATSNIQARGLQINTTNGTVSNNDSVRSAFGLNVRCMKI